jgi:biopolymer transport protein TolR
MSMDVGGAKGGVKSDINVTPLVDVMLVLLVIMMIIAPMLQQGIPVKLPQAANTVEKPETQGQTVIAIQKDKKLYLNSKEIGKEELTPKVKDIMDSKPNKKDVIVLLKADAEAPYSAVMETMDMLRTAGVEDIGLIAEKKRGSGSAAGGM